MNELDLQEPYWEDYEDGSGSLCGSFGKHYFAYDMATREIQDIYGKWQYCDFESNWRERYINLYKKEILPKEIIQYEHERKGITDAFSNYQVILENKDAQYVAVSEEFIIPRELFETIHVQCQIQEDKMSSNHVTHCHETAKRITDAIKNERYAFKFEGETFSFDAESVISIEDYDDQVLSDNYER